jgi:hypothetical protein
MSATSPADSPDFYPAEQASEFQQEIYTFDLAHNILFQCTQQYRLQPTLETEAQLKSASLQACATFGHALQTLCETPIPYNESLEQAKLAVNFFDIASQEQANRFDAISNLKNKNFSDSDLDLEQETLQLANTLQHGKDPVATVFVLCQSYFTSLNANLCAFLNREDGSDFITPHEVAHKRAALFPEEAASQSQHNDLLKNVLKFCIPPVAALWVGHQLFKKVL